MKIPWKWKKLRRNLLLKNLAIWALGAGRFFLKDTNWYRQAPTTCLRFSGPRASRLLASVTTVRAASKRCSRLCRRPNSVPLGSTAVFWIAIFSNFYGTSRRAVEAQLTSGIDVILEIDWQGAAQVRQIAPETVSIFILPPTREVLRERLIERNQDDTFIIDARMDEADETINQATHFDYWIINDDFKTTLDQLKSIILSYRQRRARIRSKNPGFLEHLLG